MYEIRNKQNIKDIDADLCKLLNQRFKGKSGIIYCLSRKDCERVCETL